MSGERDRRFLAGWRTRRRDRPQLVLLLPYEGEPKAFFVADTLEDERALRHWLRAHELLDLPQAVLELLDALDALDDMEAA
jgi:hypothetical protein